MFRLLYFVAGGLAAYWIFQDSRKREHPLSASIAWAVGAAISCIIFLPLYFLFGRKEKAEPVKPGKAGKGGTVIDITSKVVERNQELQCEVCGKAVKKDFRTCPYCSHELRRNCKCCGQPLEKGESVCASCDTHQGENK